MGGIFFGGRQDFLLGRLVLTSSGWIITVIINLSELWQRMCDSLSMDAPKFVSRTLQRICHPKPEYGADFNNHSSAINMLQWLAVQRIVAAFSYLILWNTGQKRWQCNSPKLQQGFQMHSRSSRKARSQTCIPSSTILWKNMMRPDCWRTISLNWWLDISVSSCIYHFTWHGCFLIATTRSHWSDSPRNVWLGNMPRPALLRCRMDTLQPFHGFEDCLIQADYLFWICACPKCQWKFS